jgi:hypothetical protein
MFKKFDGRSQNALVAGVALALVLSLTGCQSAADKAVEAAAQQAAQQAAIEALKPDIPAGFKDGGNGVAYRFANEGNECSYGSCVFVELYAYYECSSMVYVKGNTLDRATDTVYGYTNATLGSLSAGQRGVVELKILEDKANAIQLTEINCY